MLFPAVSRSDLSLCIVYLVSFCVNFDLRFCGILSFSFCLGFGVNF